MDLKEFDGLSQAQEDGQDVPILHPKTGDELGIVIRVAGPDSDRLRKARAAVVNERLSRKRVKLSAAEIEAEGLSLLAAAVISWTGVVIDGKEIECTKSNAEAVLKRFPFIREQLDAVVGDRAGFMKS